MSTIDQAFSDWYSGGAPEWWHEACQASHGWDTECADEDDIPEELSLVEERAAQLDIATITDGTLVSDDAVDTSMWGAISRTNGIGW